MQHTKKHYSTHTIIYHTISQKRRVDQFSTVQNSTIQYSTVQYSTVQYKTVQNSTVHYNTVQYTTSQYSKVQNSTVLVDDNKESQYGNQSIERCCTKYRKTLSDKYRTRSQIQM